MDLIGQNLLHAMISLVIVVTQELLEPVYTMFPLMFEITKCSRNLWWGYYNVV